MGIRTYIIHLVAGIGLLIQFGASQVHAGSPVQDLAYKFPCRVFNQSGDIELYFGGGFSPSSVSLEYRGGNPVFAVNDQLAFEQPFEVVAFEYFSACEQARNTNETQFRNFQNDARQAENFLRNADCSAIAALDRNGIVRRDEVSSRVLDFFQYSKSDESVLGVPFWKRTDNIWQSCAS